MAFQFHGCLFHGHPNCPISMAQTYNLVNGKALDILWANTDENYKYLTGVMKVKVVVMLEYECRGSRKSTHTFIDN